MKHLYIHIPFCHRRCAYCDFNTYANMDDRIEAYVAALCAELRLLAETVAPAPPASAEAASLRPTIFLGGGTPTMLSLGQMERVLEAASLIVPLAGAEVSSEANPGTVLGRDYLRGLRRLGVNRLSMGVQSLHDPTLRILGRIHTADEARRSYAEAREAGFENINLDFIFGLPGQDQAQWDATLDEIVAWEVDHFSLYSLILEEKTPLFAQVTAGRVSVPDDDATAAMYEAAMARFAAAGYAQYEISNFARGNREQGTGDSNCPAPVPCSLFPERACHHNLAYWLNSDYLAAGAGAYGHITAGGSPHRYYDTLAVEEYIVAAGAGGLRSCRRGSPLVMSAILVPPLQWVAAMLPLTDGIGQARSSRWSDGASHDTVTPIYSAAARHPSRPVCTEYRGSHRGSRRALGGSLR
ncbi:radical SAM family heme chaperone HemW [Oscillochloris sp. ZM17-4]|nr:radical SAM family heme chaperone HemW [Oscillochloris sp. ZM17-4]